MIAVLKKPQNFPRNWLTNWKCRKRGKTNHNIPGKQTWWDFVSCFLSFARHSDTSVTPKMMKFAEAARSFSWKSFCTATAPLGKCGLDTEVVSKLVVCVLAMRYLSIWWFGFVFFSQRHSSSSYWQVSLKSLWKDRYAIIATLQNLPTAKCAAQEQNSTHWAEFCQHVWDAIFETAPPFRVTDEVEKYY